jgi:hypothetical protein
MRHSCVGSLWVLFVGFVLGGIIGWMSLPSGPHHDLPPDAGMRDFWNAATILFGATIGGVAGVLVRLIIRAGLAMRRNSGAK